MSNTTEILMKYKNGEIDAEEANKELIKAGSNLVLDPNKNPSGGWTDAEMEEGHFPGEPAKILPDRPDMSRNEDLVGMSVVQIVKGGKYRVEYDELGYAVKAVKI